MAVDPLIELRDVNKYYGEPHVPRDIDLTVGKGEKGEVVVVTGPSGSGRSTLCGTVFRSFDLFAHRTVLRTISPGRTKARGHGRGEGEAGRRSRELLDRVGVASPADTSPARLSGGRRQRVALARALAVRPKAPLFDGPTSAPDPEMTNEVLDVMRRSARDEVTTAVVTHETVSARSAANRVVVMDCGRVMADRSPEEFSTDPRGERAEDLLSTTLKH